MEHEIIFARLNRSIPSCDMIWKGDKRSNIFILICDKTRSGIRNPVSIAHIIFRNYMSDHLLKARRVRGYCPGISRRFLPENLLVPYLLESDKNATKSCPPCLP
jgi:hypothetical protein